MHGNIARAAASPPRRSRISYASVAGIAAAIATVYAIGYLRTADATRQRSLRIADGTGASIYHDGTYNGRGVSPHGYIGVQVVIQGGHIVSADILRCGTQYPCSLVAPLRSEVIAQQSVPVDVISRATDSSLAYRGGIASALSQAQ
jgi:uncharacterized protein with FMN-binding domain